MPVILATQETMAVGLRVQGQAGPLSQFPSQNYMAKGCRYRWALPAFNLQRYPKIPDGNL